MAYIANTPDDVRVMLGRDRARLARPALRHDPAGVPAQAAARRSPRRLTELELTDHIGGLLAAEPGGRPAGLLPGRRQLRPLHPGRRRQPRRARRVLHGLHALPGRGQPGDAPGDVRVSDADHPADRAWTSPTPASTTAARPSAEAMLMALTDHPPVRPGRRRRVGPSRVPPDPLDVPRPPGARARHGPAPTAARSPPSRLAAGDHRPDRGRGRPVPQLLRPARGRRGARRRGPRQGRAGDRERRPDQPGPAPTGRATTAPTSSSPRASRWATRCRYGGPYLGIMACREEYVRKMPGRIVGQTTDRHGKRCWVLTLQTREQHIRREKATSNICTNQGLLALRASIYLAAMGPSGLRQAAELSTRKAHYAAERLAAVPGLSLAFPGPFFKEFVVRSQKDPDAGPRRGRPARLSRRDRPGPLVSRPRRLHPDRRHREADQGRDRRAGRGVQ